MITSEFSTDLYYGRAFIVLSENDGHETHIHGIATAPVGVGANVAYLTVNDALEWAKENDPDEWNYDDVKRYLTEKGWDMFNPTIWVEGQ